MINRQSPMTPAELRPRLPNASFGSPCIYDRHGLVLFFCISHISIVQTTWPPYAPRNLILGTNDALCKSFDFQNQRNSYKTFDAERDTMRASTRVRT